MNHWKIKCNGMDHRIIPEIAYKTLSERQQLFSRTASGVSFCNFTTEIFSLCVNSTEVTFVKRSMEIKIVI